MSSYTVRPGDSLFLIARRFGTSPEALAQANGIHDPRLIYPGVTLQIPELSGQSTFTANRYTVQPGDSLFLIGRRFGMTAEGSPPRTGSPPGPRSIPARCSRFRAVRGRRQATAR